MSSKIKSRRMRDVFLYEKVVALDENLFDILYDEYHTLIWYIAKPGVKADHEIVDLEIAIFDLIIRNISRLNDPEDFSAYVSAIINNEVKQAFAKSKKMMYGIKDLFILDHLVYEEKDQHIFELLTYLNALQKYVVVQRVIFLRSYKDIGDDFRVSANEVREILDDALITIKKGLEADGINIESIISKKDDDEEDET